MDTKIIFLYCLADAIVNALCQNYKRFRCKLFQGKKFHGFTASKKQYFLGIKVHMIVSAQGVHIEFVFSPGSEADLRGMQSMQMDLPQGASLFADGAYTDYALEDFLREEWSIQFIAKIKAELT